MIAPELQSVLATAGYLQAGRSCAPGVKLGQAAQEGRRGRRFSPDARWQGASSLRVYFKYALDTVTAATVGEWRREIWNEGNSPLLWVVSPQQTILYNAFGRPQQKNDAEANCLKTFDNIASELDEAVLTLYGLDETERIVVEDGLFRAHWQWQAGRRESMAPAGLNDMASYARAFLGTMDAWFSARNVGRMRAEIFALPRDASLRVIRFVLEEHSGPSILKTVPLEGRLADLLKRIGERLNVRITDSIASARELHAHGPNEVVIIKPSVRRHWLGVSALEDADAVVVKGISGAAI